MRSDDPHSTDTMLVALTDEQALGLCPGDVVIVQTCRGLAPLLVERVRPGVAYTDSNPPDAYEVPVIEGFIDTAPREGERPSVWAVPDCYLPLTDAEVAALTLSGQREAA